MIINDIITQHPESVAFLFLKFSIQKPVNVQSLSAAIISKGQPFINDLAGMVSNQYEYYNGLGGKQKKKKQVKKAQKQAQAAQEQSLRRPVNTPIELLPPAARADLYSNLNPKSQEAAQMAQQVQQQILNTPVTAGGGFWDKIGNVIGGVRGAADDIRGIAQVGNGGYGGAEASNIPGEKNPADKKTFTNWIIAAVAIVIVLVIVIAATSGSKTIAK
jgi:hypothetical protein